MQNVRVPPPPTPAKREQLQSLRLRARGPQTNGGNGARGTLGLPCFAPLCLARCLTLSGQGVCH